VCRKSPCDAGVSRLRDRALPSVDSGPQVITGAGWRISVPRKATVDVFREPPSGCVCASRPREGRIPLMYSLMDTGLSRRSTGH